MAWWRTRRSSHVRAFDFYSIAGAVKSIGTIRSTWSHSINTQCDVHEYRTTANHIRTTLRSIRNKHGTKKVGWRTVSLCFQSKIAPNYLWRLHPILEEIPQLFHSNFGLCFLSRLRSQTLIIWTSVTNPMLFPECTLYVITGLISPRIFISCARIANASGYANSGTRFIFVQTKIN